MKTSRNLALFLILIGMIVATSCNRNYYSGTGKGGKNCGCPSHKGLTGY